MPRFLVNVIRPAGFDHAAVLDAAARAEIDAVNEAMEAAGVREFVGGLKAPESAQWIGADHNEGGAYVDGFWVLDCADMAAARLWGERAASACRAAIEIRQFH